MAKTLVALAAAGLLAAALPSPSDARCYGASE